MNFDDFAYNQKPYYVGIEFDANEITLHRTKQFPPVNITETKACYYVRMLVPGIEMNNLHIIFKENQLEVKGSLVSKKGKYEYHERITGHFRRLLTFTHCIVSDEIKAEVQNGILKITLPKETTDKQEIKAVLKNTPN